MNLEDDLERLRDNTGFVEWAEAFTASAREWAALVLDPQAAAAIIARELAVDPIGYWQAQEASWAKVRPILKRWALEARRDPDIFARNALVLVALLDLRGRRSREIAE